MGGLLARGTTAGVAETATLLASELVTNAVVHAQSPTVVKVVESGASVRIEVDDRGSGVPVVAPADPTSEGGRGLALVRDLSTAWGVIHQETGKTVWFTLGGRGRGGSRRPPW